MFDYTFLSNVISTLEGKLFPQYNVSYMKGVEQKKKNKIK